MNERIWQLQGQAKRLAEEIVNQRKYDDYMEYKQSLMDQTMNKFAELIVQEMCNVLDKEQWNIGRDWICDDGTRIIPKVKEHFGVEE